MSDLSDEDSDGIKRILGAGRHLLALINELIDIARIESGDLSLSLEPVLVRPLIEESSQLMAPIAAERSIRIILDCTHPALAVRADRQRLSQVLVNLISNAIKYNRGTAPSRLPAGKTDTGQASIEVSDTGPGMSPENIERIFIPFERLGAEQTAVEGTGIGLPLAKALTEAMHGQLTASSVLGQGSAFTVSLPRAPDLGHVPAPGLAPASPAAGPHSPAGISISILYIEDNPANVEVISRFLRGRPNTTLRSDASGRARPRIRRPGQARPHPARPAPARPARRPGTQGTQGRTSHRRHPGGSPFRRRIPWRHPPPARRRRARLPHQAHRARRTRQAARHLRRRRGPGPAAAVGYPDHASMSGPGAERFPGALFRSLRRGAQ